MRFDLLDYETTVGHLSFYYDAGGMFDVEINAGRYLAGDWGATTTISRKFGSGWEVGGYATLTDVPFDTFGEGSFDKAIYVSVPIDWIVSSPNRTKRRLTLRPITRDGGAQLSGARQYTEKLKTSKTLALKRIWEALEMNKILKPFFNFILASCSNTTDMETGEINPATIKKRPL